MVPLLTSMVGLNSLSYEKFSAGNKEGEEGGVCETRYVKLRFLRALKWYFRELVYSTYGYILNTDANHFFGTFF